MKPGTGGEIRLETVDLRSADNTAQPAANLPLATLNDTAIPARFELLQNYPNPFNPVTHIPFQLPEAARVKIQIVNLLGQPVRTLTDTRHEAGFHEIIWDGRNDLGEVVVSGIYLVRMHAAHFHKTREILFIK